MWNEGEGSAGERIGPGGWELSAEHSRGEVKRCGAECGGAERSGADRNGAERMGSEERNTGERGWAEWSGTKRIGTVNGAERIAA